MKKICRYTCAFILAVGTLTGLQGCKDYFDLHDNPNLVSNSPLSAMLSTATHKTGLNSYRVANITSYFTQHLASPSAGGATDTYQDTDYTSTWDNLQYAMADIYDMREKAQQESASQYLGVANILMVYHLSLVSDLWGDAPYSDAYTTATLTPKFDSQEDIYKESLRLLDEAIAELARTDSKLVLDPANDLLYAGKVENWTKLAYALKARLLNKVSKTAAYDPTAVLAAVDQAFTSSADDAQMAVFDPRNPWASIAISNTQLLLGGWLSSQLVNSLNGTLYGFEDPRIAKITDKTVNGVYVGTPNGVGNVGSASNTVRDESYISLNSPLTGDTSPLLLVTYAEVKMIEAEAAFRAGNLERAYTAYLEGIEANMDKLQVPASERDAYLANAAVAVGAPNLTLALIFKEKYVITYLNPEAWNDARRYDYQYKGFTMPVGAALSTFIRRVAYPSGESSKNVNVPAPSTYTLDKPLWWDK